jgi:1,4-alpha-glucan branching enzyme
MLTADDAYLFAEGTHARLFDVLGCHVLANGHGARLAVWAPNAEAVAAVGDWNDWNDAADPLTPSETGVWEAIVPAARRGHRYKFRVKAARGRFVVDKADPLAWSAEEPPSTASRVWSLEHEWHDQAWMQGRSRCNAPDAAWSIYEMHLGSWRRAADGFLDYRALADSLCAHAAAMGFTHVELMPVTEHPFYGSWGYQTTGYFAPTARYGTPQDFMAFVDRLHEAGIGVILDWVPSHFPTDEHGLQFFDGTHLYEHADPRQGFHPEWNSSIFNYGRGEVRSFLISSALFWLEKYHIDALRVDAVASMLYLDYARGDGGWIPNQHGGKENLEAIGFLRALNLAVAREFPEVAVIAEESTAWPLVTRQPHAGGLGFSMKWNMGWMHDTLAYLREDPVHRRYHHHQLTFSLAYAFSENFVLPLSHDEVVYGKGSLLQKMPGDDWRRLAGLRGLLAYMWTHPGKKLLFMGGEFGQLREWSHDRELDWDLTRLPGHGGVMRLVADLNRLYRGDAALHALDFSESGFEWVEAGDAERSVIAFLRKPAGPGTPVLVLCNFTPVPRENYLCGVPLAGAWREVLNSDAREYGGSGWGNLGSVQTAPLPAHGRRQSLRLTLPPLATLVLRHDD